MCYDVRRTLSVIIHPEPKELHQGGNKPKFDNTELKKRQVLNYPYNKSDNQTAHIFHTENTGLCIRDAKPFFTGRATLTFRRHQDSRWRAPRMS